MYEFTSDGAGFTIKGRTGIVYPILELLPEEIRDHRDLAGQIVKIDGEEKFVTGVEGWAIRRSSRFALLAREVRPDDRD